MDTPAPAPLRAVIYSRTSADHTGEGRSVESQEAACRRVIGDRGWQLVTVIADNDMSGSRHAKRRRPGYKQLSRLVEAREVDVIVATELSRVQRDDADFTVLRDLAAANGVLFSYGGRVYDLTRADDRFATGLDMLLAAREADIARERTMRGIARSAERGRPPGRLKYGFTRVYDERGAYLRTELHPERAPIVREAARRVAAGEAPHSIALDFNRRGIPTPADGARGWDLTQIRRMVTSPAYVALRVFQEKITGPGDWPPILDEATWNACVQRFADPSRRSNRDTRLRWLLSGHLGCGVCGSALRVQKTRGYQSYICKRGFCVAIKATLIEQVVTELVLARLARPDLGDLLQAGDDGAASARKEAEELRARLDGFYEQAATGAISPAGLAAIERRLLPQIEEAASRATRRADPLVLSVAGPNPAGRWAELSIGQQRQVVAALVDPLLLGPTQRGARTFDPARLYSSRWAGDERTWGDLSS